MAKAQIPCPKCGSFKVMSDKALMAIVGFAMMFIGGLLGFLIFPLIFIPIGFVSLLIGAFMKIKTYTCNACHYKFSPSEIKKAG